MRVAILLEDAIEILIATVAAFMSLESSLSDKSAEE